MTRTVAVTLAGYAVLLAGMVRWQIAQGQPYERATPALFFIMAICAALIGLIALGASLGALHWARRAAAGITATTLVVGAWFFFSVWNAFLVWQVIVLLSVQVGCLVGLLGGARLTGLALRPPDDDRAPVSGGVSRPGRGLRVSTLDLLILTASFAFFFAVAGAVQPAQIDPVLATTLSAGGACAAIVTAVACWSSLSAQPPVARVVVALLAAPLGGIFYAVAARYQGLLFSASWYAGVTALQMLLIVIPSVVMRRHGYRLRKSP